MGMGDVKEPYVPRYGSVRCDVSGLMFASCMVRDCKDPAVIKRYGTGGVAKVSVYVCRKCRHAIHYKFHGGLGCELDIPKRGTGDVG